MSAIPPLDGRDPKDNQRQPWLQLVRLAVILCTTGLLWIWLSAGEAYSQPFPQGTPLETPTHTPDPFAVPTSTPDPFALPTETPDPFAVPTSTPDPFALPTETPDPFANGEDPTGAEGEPLIEAQPTDQPIAAPLSSADTFSVIEGVVAGMTRVAVWLWFLCGSLIFFVVAGIVGGVLFSQRERHRYDLYEVEPEENALLEVVEPQKPNRRDDDSWPASLP